MLSFRFPFLQHSLFCAFWAFFVLLLFHHIHHHWSSFLQPASPWTPVNLINNSMRHQNSGKIKGSKPFPSEWSQLWSIRVYAKILWLVTNQKSTSSIISVKFLAEKTMCNRGACHNPKRPDWCPPNSLEAKNQKGRDNRPAIQSNSEVQIKARAKQNTFPWTLAER